MSEDSTLNEYFGPSPTDMPLGIVVGGSLSSGLEIKFDSRLSIEKLAAELKSFLIPMTIRLSTFFQIIVLMIIFSWIKLIQFHYFGDDGFIEPSGLR